jgi:hypothetical protein
MPTSQLVYVVTYEEKETPHFAVLGVFASVELGKKAGDEHYKKFHTQQPLWVDDPLGAKAEHLNGCYLVREVEVVTH